jgi:hypothetical protein
MLRAFGAVAWVVVQANVLITVQSPGACAAGKRASNTVTSHASARLFCYAVPAHLVPFCLELLVLCLCIKQQGSQLLQI